MYMLGCSASDLSLLHPERCPGCINQEIQGIAHLRANIMYSIQAMGWVDVPTYQSWAQYILCPYAAMHANKIYLLRNQFSVNLHSNSITTLHHLGINVGCIQEGYSTDLQWGQ
jgi:hypothetical protein